MPEDARICQLLLLTIWKLNGVETSIKTVSGIQGCGSRHLRLPWLMISWNKRSWNCQVPASIKWKNSRSQMSPSRILKKVNLLATVNGMGSRPLGINIRSTGRPSELRLRLPDISSLRRRTPRIHSLLSRRRPRILPLALIISKMSLLRRNGPRICTCLTKRKWTTS